MEEKPRLARLTAILTQLQSQRLVTATQLAGRHGVSVRTIYRDIRTLEKSGVPIYTEEGRGYSLVAGYRLPPVMFTEDEANALITALELVKGNKDISLTTEYGNAITKILSVMRMGQKDRTELLAERMAIRPSFDPVPTSDNLTRLQSAITHFSLVRLTYCSLQKETTKRIVEPFALYSTQGNWILVAFCRLRKAFRAFRLDHIVEMVTLSETFSPHDMTLGAYFEETAKTWKAE